ncbi:MAG: nucleoside triphosphate pyrophosphohydrolase [Ignavibacteriales bacterium]|nr:nucleoside triphosphate pyrophosphohydrolase [Ignavibacteriales bacterium]
MTKKKKISTQVQFEEFLQIVGRLRKECPWDREQTHQSIRQSLIEEAYEVVEAIDQNNLVELKKELGDLLLHVALHSVIAEEEHTFSMQDVLNHISEKLIRRHPHVFGDAKAATSREVKANWEKIKMAEGRESILDGVPAELPALLRAYRLQDKASKVGFDWKKKQDVWKKVDEEVGELLKAERSENRQHVEEELGDLLFAIVNYSRFLHVNPEMALRGSIEKFTKRFRSMEKELHRQGKTFEHSTLEEMDEVWTRIKHLR